MVDLDAEEFDSVVAMALRTFCMVSSLTPAPAVALLKVIAMGKGNAMGDGVRWRDAVLVVLERVGDRDRYLDRSCARRGPRGGELPGASSGINAWRLRSA